jgi:hypothetical protein
VQDAFVALLPKVEQVARWYFRSLRCADRKQDFVFETVAICWLWHRRLATNGRDSCAFIGTMSFLAAKSVYCGRRLCGQEKANDVLSTVCQRRRGFVAGNIDYSGHAASKFIDEALCDNTRTSVVDQVQFRVDFPDWVSGLDDRRQRIVYALMEGRSTSEVANKFGMSAARVSQLRREFYEDYTAFCGEPLIVTHSAN